MARAPKTPPAGPTTTTQRPGGVKALLTDLIFGLSVMDAATKYGLDPATLLAALDGTPFGERVRAGQKALRRFHLNSGGVAAEAALSTLAELALNPEVEPKDRINAASRLLDHQNNAERVALEDRRIVTEEKIDALTATVKAALGDGE